MARKILGMKRPHRGSALLAAGFAFGLAFAQVAPLGLSQASAQSSDPRAAHYWEQLTALMQPVEMSSMADHRAFMLPSGVVVGLHFDNMDLSQAQNLNWVALGIPGRFCAADQQRVEGAYGPGFTHFHDMANDMHGGAPGAEGVWFVHTAVRDFQAPWGSVTQGIDSGFMPTAAQTC